MCRRLMNAEFCSDLTSSAPLRQQQLQLSKSNLMLIASVLNKMRGQITSVLDKW